ncbi:unnamed protein product [Vitrella brassicaformis CCMP3155]|uniref:Uncharacterized protein n=1 Tax=Vitrella brassicaformis (strain CCMP3155) TaxID=1169540 RepID=A0A0G4FUP0_VITBC|nr:unnamed protein product [Vitrella brassicaformis CCMP3155]|eukprot:CEM18600.1 unnamed protein product [Vitrella brassicaformis CCMP3155]
MYQLSLNDIVQLLFALDRVDHIDRTVCRRVSRKVAARLSHPETKTQVEAATIAGLAAAFALHQYRSHPLYRLIARRAVMLADEFDTPSLGRLFLREIAEVVACDIQPIQNLRVSAMVADFCQKYQPTITARRVCGRGAHHTTPHDT